jgi:hypothetical protein
LIIAIYSSAKFYALFVTSPLQKQTDTVNPFLSIIPFPVR